MPRAKTFDEQQILEKAMELFWEKGYYATSIQDLVSHLGVNRASLYDTYGGKQELFRKAFEHYRGQNTQGVRQFLASQPQVKEGFRALFQRAIQESQQDLARRGCFVVNTTTELIPGDEAMLGLLTANKQAFEGIFHDYLKEGEATGQIPPGKDLKAIAALLFTLYNGLKVVSKIEPEAPTLPAAVEAALSLLD